MDCGVSGYGRGVGDVVVNMTTRSHHLLTFDADSVETVINGSSFEISKHGIKFDNSGAPHSSITELRRSDSEGTVR